MRDTAEHHEIILALAAGRIPAGVDPESPAGQHYALWAAHVVADVDAAPPMTAEQIAVVVPLLRGSGGEHRAA